MFHFVVNWFVMMGDLQTLAKLPLSVERKGLRSAALAAFRLGSPDLFRPMRTYLTAVYQWIILGLLFVGLSSFIFWITPNLLDGFQVRTGVASALINPIALSLLKPWLLWFLH